MTTWTIKTADDGEGGWMAVAEDGFVLDYFDTKGEARKAVKEQEDMEEVGRLFAGLEAAGVEIPDGLFCDDARSLKGLRALAA